jgi:Na+/H+ antiporter NhaD/arsenite permease-like protein
MLETALNGGLILGVRVEFILFALTLLGVAMFHRHTLQAALAGLAVITAWKILVTGFATGPGWLGCLTHVRGEAVMLVNILGLLLGFAILAHHFSASHLPAWLPQVLPAGWPGCFMLLVLVFILSAFLDNIAAALIGGTLASSVFKGRLHTGYLAALVAASNAGGAGSVVGDTTTTMLWLGGVSPFNVLHAYVGAGVALLFFGFLAARQQHAFHPLARDVPAGLRVDGARLAIIGLILLAALATNLAANLWLGARAGSFPWIGGAIWLVILLTTPWRSPHWAALPGALRGTLFLLALVLAASLMPVETLPTASWRSTLGLGFVSAVFDNIPLTALALKQGGYDWNVLAYAVGFGGSLLWFGSSAGVALATLYPQARSVGSWLRDGWHVAVAYLLGFCILLCLHGWQPRPLVQRTAIHAVQADRGQAGLCAAGSGTDVPQVSEASVRAVKQPGK